MLPGNASYHGGLFGRGRGPSLPPEGRGAGAGRWSRPDRIPVGENGIALAASNDIQFFTISFCIA